MTNILILSFEGFSFSSRQLYEQLLPKLLSRAIVHESITIADAHNYIVSNWPNVILVTDSVIAEDDQQSRKLLAEVIEATKHGCTTILMGFFASAVDVDRLNHIFKEDFNLRWRTSEYARFKMRLHNLDENLIRASTLVPTFEAEALYLNHVPAKDVVYCGRDGNDPWCCAAYARVGLGKLGFIGDINFSEEAERLILAMSHLDRPEDCEVPLDGKE